MLFKIAALAAVSGLVAAVPQGNVGDGLVTTVTTTSTQEITITSCGPEVTYCPARVTTTVFEVVATIPAPVIAVPIVPTGATGTGGAGANGGAAATYNYPAPTAGNGAYNGPSYTGGSNSLKVGGVIGAVAVAAAALL